jgi:hypothetical protein
MVIFFLQTLITPTYDWYLYLPTRSIESFNDIEDMFMTIYAHPIACHTLLTQFTQIHFQKGERIIYFNLLIFKTLNQIPDENFLNEIILGKIQR